MVSRSSTLNEKQKKNRDEEKLLHKKVNDLQARAENNPHNRNILLELQCARSQLEKNHVDQNE